MLARVAWRNVWRNRRRTLIAVAALAVGTAAIVFTHSFAETMYSGMVDLATRGLVGHLQVRGKGFEQAMNVGAVVRDPGAVERVVERTLPGAAALRRVSCFGLAAAGERTAGVAVIGLEPEREASHSRLLQLVQGRPPAPPSASSGFSTPTSPSPPGCGAGQRVEHRLDELRASPRASTPPFFISMVR